MVKFRWRESYQILARPQKLQLPGLKADFSHLRIWGWKHCSEFVEILQMSQRQRSCLSPIQLRNHLAIGLFQWYFFISLSSLFRLLELLIIYRLQDWDLFPWRHWSSALLILLRRRWFALSFFSLPCTLVFMPLLSGSQSEDASEYLEGLLNYGLPSFFHRVSDLVCLRWDLRICVSE